MTTGQPQCLYHHWHSALAPSVSYFYSRKFVVRELRPSMFCQFLVVHTREDVVISKINTCQPGSEKITLRRGLDLHLSLQTY